MKLYLHILRAHAGPFIASFVILMFIFVLQFLMKAVDQLVGKGLNPMVIAELIALSLAWMVVLAVPMSVLVATLMAFGRLSSQNEITAMKASGMSLYRMMGLVLVCAGILTSLLIQFNNHILPESNHKFKTLMIDIRRKKPTMSIQRGIFSQDLQGYSILARTTYEYSNNLDGITIYDYTDPSMNVVVTAKRGKVSFTPDYRKLIMDLQDGEIHQLNMTEYESYRKLRFTRHRIVMNAEGFDFERSGNNAFSRGDRELSAQAMGVMVDSLEAANAVARLRAIQPVPAPSNRLPIPRPGAVSLTAKDIEIQAIAGALNTTRGVLNAIDNQAMLIKYNQDEINQKLVEIHKKYAIPFACLVFVFIGAPLGIMARKGTFGVAASVSMGFFLLYWASLIGGEKLADRGFLSPWLGMWMGNIILGVLGILLTVRMGRETPRVDWNAMRRFVPAFLRTPDESLPGAEEQA